MIEMAARKSQKALLQKLEEYGDSILDEDNQSKTSKKNKKKPKQNNVPQCDVQSNQTPITKKKLNKKQRKLLKRRQNGDLEKQKRTPMNKKMKWLKEALRSEGLMDVEKTGRVGEEVKVEKKRKQEPEVIVFEDPAKKRKKARRNEDEDGEPETANHFNMNTARFEVRKLGISGFGGEKKSEARVSLLISLGAKPPRNKSYTNYKEFQQKRKADMDAEKQRRLEEQVPGEKLPKLKSQKRPREKSDTANIDGQIGYYKRGVQFINKESLQKLKTS
ncbi:uncharacterized protein C1orf131 homolog isoform X1 [Haliotis rufescens]|uniref:uncharacterized protein C1orf131 homolog isoform X1 n=2 Tax=Haliotis rufescens TaxID=6454 RepID=UPI00201F4519|nr:uncharacterized protein C1orf131 homolog isoform X1 [Haliotis rufescens]